MGPSRLMRMPRTTPECKSLSPSCKENSSNTRCNARKPKPKPTTTCRSSERQTTSFPPPKNVPTLLKVHSTRCANKPVHLLDPVEAVPPLIPSPANPSSPDKSTRIPIPINDSEVNHHPNTHPTLT